MNFPNVFCLRPFVNQGSCGLGWAAGFLGADLRLLILPPPPSRSHTPQWLVFLCSTSAHHGYWANTAVAGLHHQQINQNLTVKILPSWPGLSSVDPRLLLLSTELMQHKSENVSRQHYIFFYRLANSAGKKAFSRHNKISFPFTLPQHRHLDTSMKTESSTEI